MAVTNLPFHWQCRSVLFFSLFPAFMFVHNWTMAVVNWMRKLLLFSHSAESNSLWPHGLHHTLLLCPSLRIRWPKYWSFSISPSSENSGFISFRIHWFDLLAVQVIFKSLLPSTTVQKHQFLSTQPSLWSSSHVRTWLLKKLYLWLSGHLTAKWCLCF